MLGLHCPHHVFGCDGPADIANRMYLDYPVSAMASDINERITQWEKMTQEAPDGMSWFSLGSAYRDADRHEEAATALREAIRLDEGLSRAHQLLGQVLIKLKQNQAAGQIITTGYRIAAARGDVMPQKAMASLLEKLGLPVPQVQQIRKPSIPGHSSGIVDRRTGQPGTRLPDPPMRGPLGTFIYDHITQETWREWIGMGTKVINELRLDFSDQAHQDVYEQHMMEWLGISREDVDAYAQQTDANTDR